MEKSSHELANELLALPDKPLTISIDVSTGEENAGDRAFSEEYLGINDLESRNMVLLFAGYVNYITPNIKPPAYGMAINKETRTMAEHTKNTDKDCGSDSMAGYMPELADYKKAIDWIALRLDINSMLYITGEMSPDINGDSLMAVIHKSGGI